MAKRKRPLSPYNRHVQREMKKGRSMKQAARSWKGKSAPRKRSAGKKTVRGRVRRAKTRAVKGGRRMARGFNTQKLYKLVRLAALGLPAAGIALGAGTNQQKINMASQAYFGYDMLNKKVVFNKLLEGWGPLLIATAVTYGIPKAAGILRGI